MTFQVRNDGRVWVLEDGQGSFAEVAPGLGFNCYRWHVPDGELLYADPKFFEDNKPTRSGLPILFPFPNRIRDGRFIWAGKDYQLPANDPSGKNAIHGFVCRKPWRVVDQGANAQSAWVTGEFVGSRDAPETLELWPADYRIAVTYRLRRDALEVHAEIANPDSKDLPFGLGYHPYFALACLGGAEAQVTLRAAKYWELVDLLPSGRTLPLGAQHAVRAGARFADLQLDDVFTDLDHSMAGLPPDESLGDSLAAYIRGNNHDLRVYMSGLFREIVGFTPPHRQAVCLEPYTCVTDAINLERQGVDTGWRVLAPGKIESGLVKLVYRTY